MTAYLLQVGQGNVSPGSLEYQTLFVVGTALFLVTTGLNLGGRWVLSGVGREGS